MKKIFTLLLMALLALAGFKSWGQETVEIGTGTSTTGVYPFYGLYNYSYSEMLYGAEEIGVAGSINSISFNSSSAASKAIDFDLDIYMKNVSRTTHSSNSDWETVSESDKVCHATLSGYTTGWITFTLDEPFAYDGTSTLMIAFDHNTGDYSSKQFYGHTSENHKSLCKYLDGSNIDPSDPAATVGASTNFSGTRPNIKINITPTGLASHTITYVQPDNGTISGPAEAYEGQTVTLTATPDANYALGQFFVNGSPIDGNTFIMPESDVTVSARFMHNFFTVDFERGIPFGWTTIDADGDGFNWQPASVLMAGYIIPAHGGADCFSSESYSSSAGALTPDNYLVSPLVQLGGSISFWACAQDPDWSQEHFGVAVSTGSNTDAADFTTISEWTGQGTWCQYTVDLSEYSGRGYVAIRHFNCTDQYILNVDDINMCFTDETDSYSISYPEQEHVSVSGISEAFAGQTVYLSTTVDEGYMLDELIVKNANTQETITVCDNQFVMPFDNVMISVSFHERQHYAVNIADGITGGTVTADPCIDVLEGTTVTLSATPATDYEFGAWIVTNVTTSEPIAVVNNQFIMPESNVTVTATFSPVLTLTVNDGTATNNSVPFEGYNIDGYLTKSQFIISASVLENMAGGTITDLTFYLSGTQNKELPAASWEIYLKEVNTTEQGYDFIDYESMTKVYTGKLSIVNYQVKIHLDTPYQYNAASENPHLMVGFKQTAKGSGTWATTNWHGAEDGSGIMRSRRYGSSGNASYNFLPKTTFTYTNPNLHGITLNQPEGGEIAASAGAALPGTIITLTATPELGYEFGEWIVTPSSVTITGNTFEMPASDVTVTATFNEVTQYGITFVGIDETLITVAATFGGETITEAPAETEVTLEYSNLDEGYTFNYWILNGEQLTGNTFTMPATDVEIGVSLSERPRYAVSIDGSITNGTITANPSSEILGGTLVTLTIIPETGYTLDVLTVTDAESNPVAVTNNQFTMPESNVTVTATFVHGITVYDGTVTNQYTAVYTYYGDTDNSAAQFVVPAEQLTAMVGGEISSIKFYVNPNNIFNLQNLGGPSYAGYITEVTETTMSNFIDFGSATTVFTGHVSLSNNNSELVIDFSAPYTYDGGNLAIAFVCTASSGYTTLNYYGTTVSGGGIYRNSGTGATINNNFIPKTTFLYTPVTPYTVNLHVNGVVSEEEVSSLPTPENIPAGMTFCGWTNSDIATYTTEAPSYVTKATADGEDFYAVFSYTEEEQTRGQNWVKITSPSELVDGEEIVLVYNNNYVVGGRSEYETNYVKYEAEISDGKIANLPTGATIFTLSGTSGSWKLNYYDIGLSTSTTLSYMEYDSDGYLCYYGMWQSWGGTSYDEWSAEGTSRVIFKNNHSYEYIGEDESVYAELIHSVANANLACEAFKKDVAMVNYYMTEVLSEGEVASATARNIVVASPITVTGRLELNENGLFRNENAAKFVFKDGAEFIYEGEEIVNATFEKDIKGYNSEESIGDGWYFIANPTANPTVDLSGGTSYDLYIFNPAAAAEWQNAQYENNVPIENIEISRETGYLYANSADFTLRFEGELIPSGEETINLTYAEEGPGIDFPGFNLIGNPFPCTAYISSDFDMYKLFNGSEVLISEDFTMDPCEAFFVEATVDNQEVTISTTAPTGKSYAMPIVVNSDRGETLDRAILHLEGTRNSHKFMMNPDRTNISFAKNGERFASVCRGDETEIPMNFTADHKGSYTISFNTENFEEEYLHLIDVVSGDDIDLLVTPSYTFEADADEYASRFRIVFGTTDINDDPATSSAPFVYISNGNLVINNVEGTASMQIVDMLGRIVRTETVSGSYNKPHNLKAGAYVITLDGRAQRIVIE